MSSSKKFNPKTDRIRKIYAAKPKAIDEIGNLLAGETRIYIDYANVRPWSAKLGWHVDPKRLKQFLDSFATVKQISFYQGTLVGDKISVKNNSDIKAMGYRLRTKDVKIMKLSVDASSVAADSTSLLEQFVRRSLLRKLDIETVEYLNGKLYEMNRSGVYYIEDRKCNFDVEIGVDMLLDSKNTKCKTFCLWSGDSDFADPVSQLLKDGKKVILFATARRVSRELNDLRKSGLIVFDLAKIRNFICWKKEIRP